MTDVGELSQEAAVRRFYDSPDHGGEGAGRAYSDLMGAVWHHGDPAAEAAGMSPAEAARVLERRLIEQAGLDQFTDSDLVLDFGSGPGGATCNMAEMTQARWVGVSNSESLSQAARAHALDRGLDDRVSFVTVGDLDYRRMLAWPDGCLAGATWYESVCHLPNRQAWFDAMFRLIRPGGQLVGVDWLRRPFGEYQTDGQISEVIDPMCKLIRLAGLGTLDGYTDMMRRAGFTVTAATDLCEGIQCWISTPAEDREKWLSYDGTPTGDLFQDGKRALDAARGAGVFTVGTWIAVRP